jgi:hypothetical protein
MRLRAIPLEKRLAMYAHRPDKCWEWEGGTDPGGYGESSRLVDGRVVRFKTHRRAYELLVGPIPEGLVIDHLCRNRRCMNPRHLEPVTHQINILRGYGPPADNARLTHCKRGHPLDGSNLMKNPKARECRICRLARKRELYALDPTIREKHTERTRRDRELNPEKYRERERRRPKRAYKKRRAA